VSARLFRLGALALVVAVAKRAHAEEAPVPVPLQADLLVKVAAYDRALPARAGDRVHVLLVRRAGNADAERAVSQMRLALGQVDTIAGLAHDEAVVTWSSPSALAAAVKEQRASIVFFPPGFADDVAGIRGALDGADVLTATAVPDYVARGIVLGFDLVSGKPKILVNLEQAKKQHVAFAAELLKLVKVVP
jgi:hypothetical protein